MAVARSTVTSPVPEAEDPLATARARAQALLLPFEPLEELPADPELWARVPLDVMARFSCVPVGLDGGRLVLAFAEPPDILRVDEVEFLLGQPIDAVVAPKPRVDEALRRHRGGEILLERASEPLRMQLVPEDEENGIDLESIPAESPIVRLVDSLILGAIDRRASDIHIETKDREVLAK